MSIASACMLGNHARLIQKGRDAPLERLYNQDSTVTNWRDIPELWLCDDVDGLKLGFLAVAPARG